MRTILLVMVLAAASIAAWWGLRQMAPGLAVEAAPAARGPIREFIDEQGKTRLPRVHVITMPFAGRIEAIDLEEGTTVSEGQTVAEMVDLDMELKLAEAQAAVDRAEAAIVENDDTTVEYTSLAQSKAFVESMEHTVQAAAERKKSGLAKREYAERELGRITRLHDKGGVTDTVLQEAEVRDVESRVDFQQDVLVHAALVAMKAGTDLMPTTVEQYIERKRLKHNVLEKERDQAKVRLREAQRDQQRANLIAPINGVVLRRQVTDEQYLAAGTKLLEIGQLEDLEVEADILSQDAVRIAPGQTAEIYGPAIGARAATATVARIFPAGFTKVSSLGVEQQRVKVILRFSAEELARLLAERGLGVEYRVQVRIFTSGKDTALTVPRSALFRGAGGQWQIFLVRDGKAVLTTVETGLLNDERAEVLSGLTENELVVLAPETELVAGAKVQPIIHGGK